MNGARKGADGERELNRILREYGFSSERFGTFSFGEWPDLVGIPDIHIEVKRREHTDLTAAMRQAEQDAERFQDGMPAVFHRRNREGWLVTMRLNDFVDLYRKGGEPDGKCGTSKND